MTKHHEPWLYLPECFQEYCTTFPAIIEVFQRRPVGDEYVYFSRYIDFVPYIMILGGLGFVLKGKIPKPRCQWAAEYCHLSAAARGRAGVGDFQFNGVVVEIYDIAPIKVGTLFPWFLQFSIWMCFHKLGIKKEVMIARNHYLPFMGFSIHPVELLLDLIENPVLGEIAGMDEDISIR